MGKPQQQESFQETVSGWRSQALEKSKFRQRGKCSKRVNYLWSSEVAKVKRQLSQHCHNSDWREFLLNPTWSVRILVLDLSLGQYQPPARLGSWAHGYRNRHWSPEMLEGRGAAASESQLKSGLSTIPLISARTSAATRLALASPSQRGSFCRSSALGLTLCVCCTGNLHTYLRPARPSGELRSRQRNTECLNTSAPRGTQGS